MLKLMPKLSKVPDANSNQMIDTKAPE